MAGKSSPEAMERMINNITKFIELQKSVASTLKSDYQVVGEEWNDKQYENLGSVIDQAVAALSANYTTLSECTTRLQLLKGKLEEYLQTNIGNN